MLSDHLKLQKSYQVKIDGENTLDHLGGKLFAIKDEHMSVAVVDADSGVIWEQILTFIGIEGLCAGDENAVYIAREEKAKRFMTAHNRMTGEEL